MIAAEDETVGTGALGFEVVASDRLRDGVVIQVKIGFAGGAGEPLFPRADVGDLGC